MSTATSSVVPSDSSTSRQALHSSSCTRCRSQRPLLPNSKWAVHLGGPVGKSSAQHSRISNLSQQLHCQWRYKAAVVVLSHWGPHSSHTR
jgi:hypothetical protein